MNPNLSLTLAIPADHPALAGHFPGRPVVPGAVILAQVAQAAVQALGAGTRIAGFPAVKFISPMLPEQRCQLALTDNGAGVIAFELTHDSQRVASGNLRYERALSVP